MAVWTVKNNGDTVLANHINDLQTGKLDSDGTPDATFIGVTVGTNAVVQDGDIRVGKNYTAEAGWHGFEEENIIENHGGHGYAAYDARPTMQGTGPYDHFVGFQSRPIYNSSGNLATYFACFDTLAVHGGAGTVANAYGLLIRDVGGVGPITNNYGIYISNLTRGTTLNYGIYVEAGGKCYFADTLKATLISQNTADGADNSYLGIGGGGLADDVTRGGCINLFGNEHALKGSIAYLGGQGNGVIHGDHIWYGGAGPSAWMRLVGTTGRLGIGIDAPLDLLHVFGAADPAIRVSFSTNTSSGGLKIYNDAAAVGIVGMLGSTYAGGYGGANCLALINTNGPIALSPIGLNVPTFYTSGAYTGVYVATADASDNAYLELAGGGAAAATRGGYINIFGNEHAQKGSVAVLCGAGGGAGNYGDFVLYGAAGPTEYLRFSMNRLNLCFTVLPTVAGGNAAAAAAGCAVGDVYMTGGDPAYLAVRSV